ncbi:MAG: ankyrin repeat domain-containing protein [Rickettsiales bacterium]|jgi:hypothetical protein|nr:ankyrin repeat domain-containing protein [Rickettsiales bacterium]
MNSLYKKITKIARRKNDNSEYEVNKNIALIYAASAKIVKDDKILKVVIRIGEENKVILSYDSSEVDEGSIREELEATMGLLITEGANVSRGLLHAANANNEQTVDFLLKKGANVNKILLHAAMKGNKSIFDFLLKKGADFREDLLRTVFQEVLFRAVMNKNESAVDFLMKNDVYDCKNLVLVDVASSSKEEKEAISLLIEKGADLNIAFAWAAVAAVSTDYFDSYEKAMDMLKAKGADGVVALLRLILLNIKKDFIEKAVDLLLEKSASSIEEDVVAIEKKSILNKALARAAVAAVSTKYFDSYEKAMDMLKAKGADLSFSMVHLLFSKIEEGDERYLKVKALDLLVEKGGSRITALGHLLSVKNVEEPLIELLLTNRYQSLSDYEEVLIELILRNGYQSLSDGDYDSEAGDFGSSLGKRPYGEEESKEDADCSSSESDGDYDSEEEREDEVKSGKGEAVILDLDIRLDDLIIPIIGEGKEFLEAKKNLEESDAEMELSTKGSEIEIDFEYVLESKDKENFGLDKFANWAYSLIKDALSSPIMFADKTSILTLPSSNHNLENLDIVGSDMGGSLLINSYEIS